MRWRCPGRCRAGYVMLTTVLIIAIAVILSAGLVRHSLNLATSSVRAERELQSKWGAVSCTRLASKERYRLLTSRRIQGDSQANIALKESRLLVELGKQQFEIYLQDESAKLNINHLYTNSDRQKSISQIRELAGASLPVQLRPIRVQNQTAMEDDFESWGQIFKIDEKKTLTIEDLVAATEKLTCWGRGININLASDEILLETASPLVGATMAHRLVQIREEGRLEDWQGQLVAAGARQRDVNRLSQIVHDMSSAYSIWVVNKSSHRTSSSFTVIETITRSMTRIRSF